MRVRENWILVGAPKNGERMRTGLVIRGKTVSQWFTNRVRIDETESCGCYANRRSWEHVRRRTIGVSSSVACHRALQETGFLDNVKTNGEYLKNRLAEELKGHSMFKEVRGSGLLVGVQFTGMCAPLVKASGENGLLVITAGKGDVLRLVRR